MNIETNKKKKQIAILGSTGSIGTQALQVIEEHPDLYEAYALTANNRVELLIAQARKFQPEVVVIANEEKYSELKEALSDMPIQYAFSYPDRISSSFDRLDFSQCTNLTFEQPDTKRFRNLALAYEAMYRGGNMPCIVNAANEVVVASFLKDGISFLGMSDVIEKTMERVAFIANPTYDDYVATDAEARKIAASLI